MCNSLTTDVITSQELEAVTRAFELSAGHASIMTRARKFGSDIELVIEETPNLPAATANALALAAREIQYAGLLARLGLFRPAFMSIRVALEAVLWGVFLSTDLIIAKKWLSDQENLSWRASTVGERGVLTSRFVGLFFPELVEAVDTYAERAQSLYRQLSGFVHGEVHTHDMTSSIQFDADLIQSVEKKSDEFVEVALFAYAVRFLPDVSSATDKFAELLESALGHLPAVRERLASIERI